MKIRFRWGPASFTVSLLALTLSLGGTGYALNVASHVPAGQAAQASLPKWHNFTLLNGWLFAGGGSYRPAFYKDSQSIVHLRGAADDGSASLAVFRLPIGDRPSHIIFVPIVAASSVDGSLEVLPDGFAFLNDANGGSNVFGYSSLDGVAFRVP